MLFINLYIVTIAAGLALLHVSFGDPRKPDKFKYESELLDKMIRMELRLERMQQEVQTTQEKALAVLQNYTRIVENTTVEQDHLRERVNMPMVAFSAYSPIDQSVETNQIVIWQRVRLNVGNAYDTVIGIFTAPTTGLYYFAVHVCNNGGSVMQYAVVLEHDHIANIYKYDNAINDCSSASVVTMVTSGQRVWIKSTSSSSQLSENSGRSSFIGVLMQK